MRTKSPFAKRWGARIRAARLDLGQNQDWLAEQLGVTQSQISRWETGQQAPTDAHRAGVAQALGLDVASLFSYNDPDDEDENGRAA